MSNSKVENISRLFRWKFSISRGSRFLKSEPFKFGHWDWILSMEIKGLMFQNTGSMYISLYPDYTAGVSFEHAPIASFILQLKGGPQSHVSQFSEKMFRTSDEFLWWLCTPLTGLFTLDVEFLDLKIYPANGNVATSICPSTLAMESISSQRALGGLSRMLDESIHTDVTINIADGTLKVHKAILCASSPVFQSMFLHNLKENQSSTIFIEDMSLECCTALVHYLYGTIKPEDFWKYRLPLLMAANKYDIVDLKDSCQESLLEDINMNNVFERLQDASLYQLNELKKGCFTYLFTFGKIHDVQDEMDCFFRIADRELVKEMFQELLKFYVSPSFEDV